jgi:hypothetical protein|uniref:Uncharacterized protein n=1 Tax=Siphoviridae sp. ctHEr2 TaxID=2826229 RepID=A0A8S5NE45_9CAUD|nr:MAG TPA: hypothetical protein [Siphoviridae sp. ctHEr2]
MYEFIKKIRRFEVKWPENCSAQWVGEILQRRLTIGAFEFAPVWDDEAHELYWEIEHLATGKVTEVRCGNDLQALVDCQGMLPDDPHWEHGIVAEFEGEEIVAEWYDTTVASDLEELAARTNYAVAVTEKGVTIDGHVAPRDLNGRPACLIRHRDGSRQWVTFAASVEALAEEMGAETKAVFPERELRDPGEVRADWWSRDVSEARW